jgi:hypothetical protein
MMIFNLLVAVCRCEMPRWLRNAAVQRSDWFMAGDESRGSAARPASAGYNPERSALQTLRHISEGTAAATGKEFFSSLTRNLAWALEVRYCFIAECTDATRLKVSMLSFWQGDDYGEA